MCHPGVICTLLSHCLPSLSSGLVRVVRFLVSVYVRVYVYACVGVRRLWDRRVRRGSPLDRDTSETKEKDPCIESEGRRSDPGILTESRVLLILYCTRRRSGTENSHPHLRSTRERRKSLPRLNPSPSSGRRDDLLSVTRSVSTVVLVLYSEMARFGGSRPKDNNGGVSDGI